MAAGAARLGHSLSAAFTHRRELEPVEAYLTAGIAAALLAFAAILIFFPMVLAWPTAILVTWIAITQAVRSIRLWGELKESREAERTAAEVGSARADTGVPDAGVEDDDDEDTDPDIKRPAGMRAEGESGPRSTEPSARRRSESTRGRSGPQG